MKPAIRWWVVVLLLLRASGSAWAAEPQTFPVPMSDGVKLATDVYLPDSGGPRFPVILLRTPYNKTGAKGIATRANAQGYAVVIQDMRGRFASEGTPVPIFANEGLGQRRDGHETLAWVEKQAWSNGRIATWGGSALGIVQNMAAPDAGPALQGQVVMQAFSDYYRQFTYRGGVWQSGIFESWARSQKLQDNIEPFRARPYEDDYWKALSPERYAEKVTAPAVFIGGWYDFYSQGTLNSFTTLQQGGGEGARGRCFLVMGPVAHGLFHERQYPGVLKAPIEPFMPMEFFAHWLKDEPLPALQPVHYYVMGAMGEEGAAGNVWRSAETWPPPSESRSYYLHADGTLSTSAALGETKRSYTFDPSDPVVTPASRGVFPELGPVDLTPVESRADVVVFTSDVLTEPLEVTGRVTAELYVSSDCPDTDFTVSLTDVYPDGRSLRVVEGVRRASLRRSYEKPEFLEANGVYHLEVDLWSTSLIFNKGHRIRVAVSSSNTPRYEPNPNTGETRYVAGKSRVANNTLHFSPDRASRVTLPVIPAVPVTAQPQVATPAGVTLKADVVYGQGGGRDLLMDIATPEGPGPFPAVVCIHGGGWRAGNKGQYRKTILELAQRGYVAVSVQYRLMPEAYFPSQVQDVKCAVRFLRAHAAEFKVKPDRIGATGASAGGHLALMLGTSDTPSLEGEGGWGGQSSRVQAVVNYFGPTDMLHTYEIYGMNDRGVRARFLGGTMDKAMENYKLASPTQHLTRDDPPILTVHGTEDPVVSIREAELLDEAARSAQVGHTLLRIEGAKHGFGGPHAVTASRAMVEFFDKHLKTP